MKKIFSMVAILALSSMSSMAAGTASGTDVTNTATLSFSVGGVEQTDVVSNTDTFKVDKKIDFLLTHDDDPKHVKVVANKQDEQRSFTLTNESNDVQKYSLSVSNLNGDTYDSKDDNADMQNLEISIDGGNNWSSSPVVTDALGADATLTVLVRGDVPASAADNKVMNIQLEATAVKDDGTTAEVSTSTADDKDAVDTVLGEGSGVSDFANTQFDGKYSAWAGYLVNTASLSLTKLSCVWKDEVTTDLTKSKRIPGATVVYVFDLNNASDSTDASDINLTDTFSTDYDLTGTVASAKFIKDKNEACPCTYGDAEGGTGADTNADATLSGQDLTIENLSVTKNSHTCVSIQAKIK